MGAVRGPDPRPHPDGRRHQGASVEHLLLLLAYAAGAATSLALALLVGGRVFAAMKRSLGVGEWVRRGLGVAVLGAVAAIAFGFDTGLLTRVSARHHGVARAEAASTCFHTRAKHAQPHRPQ